MTCICPSLVCFAGLLLLQANEPRGAEGILETKQAYEFTLDTIGQDIHSGGAPSTVSPKASKSVSAAAVQQTHGVPWAPGELETACPKAFIVCLCCCAQVPCGRSTSTSCHNPSLAPQHTKRFGHQGWWEARRNPQKQPLSGMRHIWHDTTLYWHTS